VKYKTRDGSCRNVSFARVTDIRLRLRE